MMYLALAILSSMMVSVCMRLSEAHVRNRVSMLATNYLMCSVLAYGLMGAGNPFPASEGMPFALTLGVVSGAMYLGSFLLLQWNIRENGVVLPATFMKLGVLVPTLMAVLVFRETPSATQALGVVLAIAAILMIQLEKGAQKGKSGLGLVLLLLGGGSTDALDKVFEEWGNPALKDPYLLYTFLVAMLLCALVCVVKKQGLTPADVGFGLLIGVPNYLSARFLLLSLGSVPAVIAYPTYSVGTIVLISLIGVALFKEKLSRRQTAALGVILAALVLLNI